MSSLRHVMAVDPGFRADHVLTMQFSLPPARYPSKDASATFCRAVLDRVTSLPGVKSASFSDGLPMTRIRLMKFAVEGWPTPTRGSEPTADMRGITSPDYFATLGIPLVSGRTFTNDELQQSQPVIVVNQALAAKLWPGQDAIGKHISSVGSESRECHPFATRSSVFREMHASSRWKISRDRRSRGPCQTSPT